MNQAAGSGENTRLIVLISVVATIGGFLFGFDSGVINGTQDGLHQAFRSGEWMQGSRSRRCCWAVRWARSVPAAWPTASAVATC
jgi:hypothetical protein